MSKIHEDTLALARGEIKTPLEKVVEERNALMAALEALVLDVTAPYPNDETYRKPMPIHVENARDAIAKARRGK